MVREFSLIHCKILFLELAGIKLRIESIIVNMIAKMFKNLFLIILQINQKQDM